MNELTPEQQEDVKQRQEEFLKEYQALTERLQMDFTTIPMFVPSGPGVFGVMVHPQLQDKKYLSPISPIQS